jgi:hypothetical protein
VRATSLAIAALIIVCGHGHARAQSPAATVRAADVRLRMGPANVCDVDATFSVDAAQATEIDHRLQLFDGAHAEVRSIDGAHAAAPVPIGRTQSLMIRMPSRGASTYRIRYRITQPANWAFRCPIWLPAVATSGQSGSATISVEIPDDASPVGRSLPALSWSGTVGRAALSSIPAFVRVRYRSDSEPDGGAWDLTTLMDRIAIAAIVVGSALWLWRRRR